jgi:hypothetical protein
MTFGKKVAMLVLIGTVIFPHLLFAETNLSGEYSCKGEDPDGTSYEGIATIEKVKDSYKIKWVVSQEKYSGIGIQSGDTVSFAYWDAETKKDLGISVYKITEDGKVLTGKWVSYPGKTNLGKDVMTKK